MLVFNLTHVESIGLIHVVFDGKGPPHTLSKKTFEVIMNGNRQKLSLEPVRNASISIVNDSTLHGYINMTVNLSDLSALNFTIDSVSYSWLFHSAHSSMFSKHIERSSVRMFRRELKNTILCRYSS